MSFRVGNEPSAFFAAPPALPRLSVPGSPGTAVNSTDFSPQAICQNLLVLPGLNLSDRAELSALAGETDPLLFWEELFRFARALESRDRIEAAVEVYSVAAEGVSLSGHPQLRPLQGRIQQQLDAVLGRGAFGPRAEFLFRRFAGEVADPSVLLSLGVAGAAYRVSRLAVLSRLVSSPANLLTRGFGARAAASLAGFAVEAPAFTMAGRLSGAALGRPQDWGMPALGRDLASSYLVLGGLKLAGWASGAAYRSVGAGPRARPTAVALGSHGGLPLQAIFQQTGMLGGILLGHGLEAWAGLRPHQDGATTLTDSLALLLQFNVAGRLSRHAFGPRWAAWERGLDRRTEWLGHPRGEGGSGRGPALSWGSLATPEGLRLGPEGPRIWISQMSSTDGPPGGSARPRARSIPAASRAVALSPVLRRALRLQDPRALSEVLRMIYARVQGPLRAELLNALVAVEGGQAVTRRIVSLLKDGRVYQTEFLSREVQQVVSDRITEHEQEADLFPPEAMPQSLGARRPNLRAFDRMVRELDMAPAEVARVLNRLFTPAIDLNRFVSSRGEPIYISNPDDEGNLTEYGKIGRQSLGELVFFERKRLSRNWMLHEAAKRLGMRTYLLQEIERNQRRPNLRQMARLAELYQLDMDLLRELRGLPLATPSTPPASPTPLVAVPSSNPQPTLPGLGLGTGGADSLRLSPESLMQLRSERLRQLQTVDRSMIPGDPLFREALELADYFEGIVAETRKRAERDLLTGLRNRQGLARVTPRLERRLIDQRRMPEGLRKTDHVAMIDIDFFKRVNDEKGHPNGDIVLRETAQTLAQTVRWRKDLTARYGGEEFFAFLSATGREGAMEAGERIRAAVAKALIPLDDFPPIQVTVSIGLAEVRALPPLPGSTRPRVEGSLADAIERADRALYEAKHGGRNQVVFSQE